MDVVESSHLQLNSTPLDSQSKEVVESIPSHLDSSSLEARSLAIADDLLMDSTPKTQLVEDEIPQYSYNPEVASLENAQAVDLGQCNYDPEVAYVGTSSSDSNNPSTYNGVTYYSQKALQQAVDQDFYKQLYREMQMDLTLVAPRSDSDDVDEPQFSEGMVIATGGSRAVINPHNGLPWRKGTNLCRPYMEEGCCGFGTACIFHHPWPPTEELP